MTRHLADQPRTRGHARATAYLRQDLSEAPSRATLALQARPQSRDATARRVIEYLRIARDRSA